MKSYVALTTDAIASAYALVVDVYDLLPSWSRFGDNPMPAYLRSGGTNDQADNVADMPHNRSYMTISAGGDLDPREAAANVSASLQRQALWGNTMAAPETWFEIGEIYLAMDRQPDAVAAWQSCVESGWRGSAHIVSAVARLTEHEADTRLPRRPQASE